MFDAPGINRAARHGVCRAVRDASMAVCCAIACLGRVVTRPGSSVRQDHFLSAQLMMALADFAGASNVVHECVIACDGTTSIRKKKKKTQQKTQKQEGSTPP
eukprot:TRINITY_DN8118_c0_g2_i1.p3 TRINITY_DN8118_c0_g2~~TRINITY_DN8118_c0_g2_i1.p3  ORF type:complete len:102 (-),score=9.69 TRINITY_DN8118_c0_g2_i1:43-348(-)